MQTAKPPAGGGGFVGGGGEQAAVIPINKVATTVIAGLTHLFFIYLN
jgi:hypothetical protein